MTVVASTAVKGRMLKIKFGELLARAGGLEASASFCRVGKSTLARYASTSPADAECFAPIDVVRDLEALVGEPIVTATLCSMADGVFVALPPEPATRGDLLQLMAAQAKEQSDVTSAICAALADGTVTPAEAAIALAEQEQVIRLAATLRAELMTIVEEQ